MTKIKQLHWPEKGSFLRSLWAYRGGKRMMTRFSTAPTVVWKSSRWFSYMQPAVAQSPTTMISPLRHPCQRRDRRCTRCQTGKIILFWPIPNNTFLVWVGLVPGSRSEEHLASSYGEKRWRRCMFWRRSKRSAGATIPMMNEQSKIWTIPTNNQEC